MLFGGANGPTRLETADASIQFRTFVFSVGIFGDASQLFRWDRSGAVVSGPIMYSENVKRQLSEFFYRFNVMDRVQWGWDPTVSDVILADTAIFSQAFRTVPEGGKSKLLEELLEYMGNESMCPKKVIHPSGRQRSYIVGHSVVSPKSPMGKCTLGFAAMETRTRKLVFLKDSWRPEVAGIKSEPHLYRGQDISPHFRMDPTWEVWCSDREER